MTLFKSTRPSGHTRKDSAISISLRFKSKSASSSKETIPSPSTPATFTISTPSTTKTTSPYPGPRLVKKSAFTQQKQKKTLHELVSKACEASCTLILRRSLKSEGINLLLTDPAAVDFLLLCVGCVRDHCMAGAKALPGISLVKEKKLHCAMKDMPALKTAEGKEAKAAMDALLGSLTTTHLTLLRYLLQSPFAHVSSLSPTHHPNLIFPALNLLPTHSCTPHTFLIARQPEHKEPLFRAHAWRPNHMRVTVFHGTHPCRLPLILSQGLRNMSGTRFQKHGKCLGPGIYLAKDPQTALGYAYAVEPWEASRFKKEVDGTAGGLRGQVKVLLGCEVVIPKERQWEGIIVERDEGKVMVRFVWVLPGDTYALDRGFEKEVVDAMEVLRKMRGE